MKNGLYLMTYKTPLVYRPEIDGLRAVAVMAVLLFHLGFSEVSGGFVGVDVFFVISGFLITRIVHKQVLAGSFSFVEFYARRIRRIFPALFAMLGVSTILAILFLVPGEYKSYVKDLSSSVAQIANIHFSQTVDYFAKEQSDSPLLHTWSLGVEEQFYVFWPIILLALHRYVNASKQMLYVLGIVFLSLVFSQYLVVEKPNHAFYMLYSRAWELALGGVIALGYIPSLKNKLSLNLLASLGLFLIVSSIFTQSESSFPGFAALFPVLGSGLIIYVALQGKTYIGNFLSLKPMVWVGLISYSLYLWHWPIIAFYKSYVSRDIPLDAQLGIFILSMCLAVLSYKFIETPFRQHNGCKKKVVLVGVLIVIILAPLANLLKTGYRYDWRYTAEFDPDTLKTFTGIVGECQKIKKERDDGLCIKEHNENGIVDVVFMGDSHGIHYEQAVSAWAQKNELNVHYLVTSSCPVWFVSDEGQPKRKVDCVKVQHEAKGALKKEGVRFVFMALRSDRFTELDDKDMTLPKWEALDVKTIDESRKFFDDIVQTSLSDMRDIVSSSTDIIMLGQVPLVDVSVAHCAVKPYLLGSYLVSPFPCNAGLNNSLQSRTVYSNRVVERAAKRNGVYYFNAVSYILSSVNERGEVIYRDSNHLNAIGSKFLVPIMSEFMLKL